MPASVQLPAPTPHPLLVAYHATSPSHLVLQIIRKIKSRYYYFKKQFCFFSSNALYLNVYIFTPSINRAQFSFIIIKLTHDLFAKILIISGFFFFLIISTTVNWRSLCWCYPLLFQLICFLSLKLSCPMAGRQNLPLAVFYFFSGK